MTYEEYMAKREEIRNNEALSHGEKISASYMLGVEYQNAVALEYINRVRKAMA